jgi:hypothetical protein
VNAGSCDDILVEFYRYGCTLVVEFLTKNH